MSDGNSSLPTHHRYLQFGQEPDLEVDANGKYGYGVGGRVEVFSAGATLLIGDYVYLSAANTVAKSATLATTKGKGVGVVVGGKKTNMECVSRKLDVGVQAALSTEPVLVQVSGKAWVKAGAAIAVGDALTPSATTSGRVETCADVLAVDGTGVANIIGNALEAAGAAATVIMARLYRA